MGMMDDDLLLMVRSGVCSGGGGTTRYIRERLRLLLVSVLKLQYSFTAYENEVRKFSRKLRV